MVLVAEGVFSSSSSSSSVHIWRILTGRVSIKEGSTMKKIAGAKGQVGGGQQGERGLNGSRTAAFGGVFVWRRRACLCVGSVCTCVHMCSSRERPKCGREVCQVTLFHSPPPPFTLASVPLLLPPAHRNTCSLLGSHYRGPACILGKDFTVRGHRLLLSNKQSGTSGCPWTHSPAPPSLLILSRPPPPPPQCPSCPIPPHL